MCRRTPWRSASPREWCRPAARRRFDVAVLAVVTSSPKNVEGGHLVIARALVAAALEAGHDAHLVVTADFGFGRQARSYLANWRTNIATIARRRVDQVIS